MAGPLAGIKIVDLSNVLMGPFATQQLGDMGAEVVKVESAAGDLIRYASPGRSKGMSSLFLNNNRNKRSIVLDLKQAEGIEVLLRLVADSDVLVSNMRADAMLRLGLSYDDVRAANDKIIYVTCTGFGKGGPYDGRPAYDDLIQTMAGIPSLIARAYDEEPKYLPSNFCDRVTGLKVVGAVTAALFYRERTGKGQAVDIPMLESMVEFVMSDHLAGHTYEPPTERTGYQRIVNPNRRPYQTKDGYLALLVYSDKQWTEFFKIIGQPEKASEEPFCSMTSRGENIVEVYQFVREVLATRTTDEWIEIFEHSDMAYAPVQELEDLLDDAHLKAVDFFPEHAHPSEGKIRTTAIPGDWSESEPELKCDAPRLGQHSREILLELGYSDENVKSLADKNVTSLADDVG
ncbi:MAG: CaiB/BaiF CoA transferase family protein [Woeseiaceae bacterium]